MPMQLKRGDIFEGIPGATLGFFAPSSIGLLLSRGRKARERLKRDGIKVEAASLLIGLPIFEAASDEGREELQNIWASLLAAAADPARSKYFRVAFIETAKGMDPLDALLLNALRGVGGRMTNDARNSIAAQMHVSRDQVEVSIGNLSKLGVLEQSPAGAFLTAFGREFLHCL
jgi:Abortive infection alpha